ncbi:MAG TPA: glycosyltransferase [Verrucomicrobiae bacterium]|jgi:glycosyltransferase involved in cell wall biosynthesis|nr:glycosyltransferase [Verrucomicrobiae bacterium]
MSDQDDKPLLTFAVVGYNQERFMREALEGTFSQTYSPLEIILSDDCSNDRSFDIMSEMAAAYRGPHRVVLNRNESRLGLGGHINRVMELVRGELVLVASGDDVSLPQRVEVVCQAWQSDGKRATTVYSTFVTINEAGELLHAPPSPEFTGSTLPLVVQTVVPREFVRDQLPAVTGCANAWSPQLFSTFGPLPTNIVYEDMAITFRSVLGGRILLVDVPLVKYRLHQKNLHSRIQHGSASITSIRDDEASFQKKFERRAIMQAGFLADLETAHRQGILSEEEYGGSSNDAQRLRDAFLLQSRYMNSGFLMKTWILCRLVRISEGFVSWRALLRRWMPVSLILITKLGLSRLRSSAALLKPRRPAAKADGS